jgi:Ca2+-binding RTX toxin-like protein
MAQYTSFGYDWTSPGHTPWAFVFLTSPLAATFDAANSNSIRLIYNDSDGTQTWVNGTGLTSSISWTTLTSLEHRASDGTLLERIDNLGATGTTPGSSQDSALFALLMAGNDTVTGSAGRDAMAGGDGDDVFFGGIGADRLEGGRGSDTFRLTANDFNNGGIITGDGSGLDDQVDTLQLENVGSLDLRVGTVTGIDTVNFFSGTSSLTISGASAGAAAGADGFKTFIGGAGADTLTLADATGQNFSGLAFTNWTPGQDTINILVSGNATTTGTGQNDTFIASGNANTMDGGAGDDIFAIDSRTTGDNFIGGTGTDTIKLRSANYDFTNVTVSSIEQLVYDTGNSAATFSQAQLDAGIVPTIVGSGNLDQIVIGGTGTVNGSALVLTSWTEGEFRVVLTDTTANGATTFTGSSHQDTINGNDGNDVLNGKAGADFLRGGTGADRFVFDDVALTDAQSAVVDHVRDYDQTSGAYNFGEGDQIDLSSLLASAYHHGTGEPVSSLVRAIEDPSGTFANLQVDADGSANGANWTTIAILDGLHLGNSVNVILDSTLRGGSAIDVITEPTGSVSIDDVSFAEGDSGTKIATFTVTRSGGTAAFDVNVATFDGSATVGDSDYVAKSGTLHFGEGVNTQTVSVTIDGDTKFEANETFFVNLSGATNGVTIGDGHGVGTILNDDPSVFGATTFKLAAFAPDASGWDSNNHYPRELADVNGDGRADIVGFGEAGVFVSLTSGNGDFGPLSFELQAFGNSSGGWNTQDHYPRQLADVNGDGMADIVGFGEAGVYVSLASGGGHFGPLEFKLAAFGPSTSGWNSNDQFPRELADVNGDGMADIVGFGQNGVYEALATGGGNFGPLEFKYAGFSPSTGGWNSNDQFPRQLADVNLDGKVDIVGFGQAGVYLAFGNGDGSFRPITADVQAFAPDAAGWTSQDAYPRYLADVNHDGAADIVGFGQNGVFEALSNGFHLI